MLVVTGMAMRVTSSRTWRARSTSDGVVRPANHKSDAWVYVHDRDVDDHEPIESASGGRRSTADRPTIRELRDEVHRMVCLHRLGTRPLRTHPFALHAR